MLEIYGMQKVKHFFRDVEVKDVYVNSLHREKIREIR